MTATPHSNPRRQLLKGGSVAIAAAFGGPIAALASRVAEAAACNAATASVLLDSPYGAVAPVNDLTTGLPLIELPPGFSYKSYGWRGDIMADGLATPSNHDGMGVVLQRRVGRSTEIVLVRNHELSNGSSAAAIIGAGSASVAKYDTGRTASGITGYQLGGTSNLVFRDGQWVSSYASFGGTYRNCAGGCSTWGSWLTNEEVRSNTVSDTGKRHGYVFEVPADTSLNAASTNPIVGMGRMAHEACAIDPATGYWYLTEDQGNANTLYRFRPANLQGGLHSLQAGGQLQGLKLRNVMNADLRGPTLCQEFDVEWVDIANPDLDGANLASVLGTVSASGPYLQAYAKGAAIFGANEGCWVANGVVFFTDKQVTTSPARAGRIWALDLASGVLKAIFVSNDISVGNSPDNLCISPRGGVLFCEDGGNSGPNSGPAVTQQRLMVVHPNGGSSIFAKNNYNFTAAQLTAAGKPAAASGNLRNTEWCGACFSPDGRVLFANLQGPGVTLAITGPWANGSL
ncbi:PhoX family protein [Aquabacterium sp.]|uniref:PhoX family protein n=1 Tax=Aquabacterium sp. TaxID=1872578 RepID=UPI002BED0343|nr:alkaline phosphatase PhoX [Aquabacterium sp.]HSW05423.1 alkaline phosphatase PhoX [Aquabacterium sp.]